MHRVSRRATRAAIFLAASLCAAAHGQSTVYWTAGSDLSWSTAANWSGGSPAGNDLLFTNDGSTTSPTAITSIVDSDTSISTLKFIGSGGFQNINLAHNVTLAATGTLRVGGDYIDPQVSIGGDASTCTVGSMDIRTGTLDIKSGCAMSVSNLLIIGNNDVYGAHNSVSAALNISPGASFSLGSVLNPATATIGYNPGDFLAPPYGENGTTRGIFSPDSSANRNIELHFSSLNVGYDSSYQSGFGEGTVDFTELTGPCTIRDGIYIANFGPSSGHFTFGNATLNQLTVPEVWIGRGDLNVNSGATLTVNNSLRIGYTDNRFNDDVSGALNLATGAGLVVGSESSPAEMIVGYNRGTFLAPPTGGNGLVHASFSPDSASNPNIQFHLSTLNVGYTPSFYGSSEGTLDLSHYTGALSIRDALNVGGGYGDSTGHFIFGNNTLNSLTVPRVNVRSGDLTLNPNTTLSITDSLSISGHFNVSPGDCLRVGAPDAPADMTVNSAFAPSVSSTSGSQLCISTLTVNGSLDLSQFGGTISVSTFALGDTSHFTFGNSSHDVLAFPNLTANGTITLANGATLSVANHLTVNGTLNFASNSTLQLGTPAQPASLTVGGLLAPNANNSANLQLYLSSLAVSGGTVDLSNFSGSLAIPSLSIQSDGHFIFGNTSLNQLTIPTVTIGSGELKINAGANLAVTNGISVGSSDVWDAANVDTATLTVAQGGGLTVGSAASPVYLSVGGNHGTFLAPPSGGNGTMQGYFNPDSSGNRDIRLYLTALSVGSNPGLIYGTGEGFVDLSKFTGPLSIRDSLNVGVNGQSIGHFIFGNAQLNQLSVPDVSIGNGNVNINSGATLVVTDSLEIGYANNHDEQNPISGALNLAPNAGLIVGSSSSPATMFVGANQGVFLAPPYGTNGLVTGVFAPDSAKNPNVQLDVSTLTIGYTPDFYGSGEGTVDFTHFAGHLSIQDALVIGSGGRYGTATGHFYFGNGTLDTIHVPTLVAGTGDCRIAQSSRLVATNESIVGTFSQFGGVNEATASISVSGSYALSNATLQLDAASSIDGNLSLTAGTILLNDGINIGTISTVVHLNLNHDLDVDLAATSSVIQSITPGPGRAPGVIDLGGTSRAFNVADGSADADLIVAAPIVNGSLIKAGAGVLRIDTPGQYAGSTTVAGGTLRLGVALAVPETSDISILSAATLDLNGIAETISTVSGSGAIALSGASLRFDGFASTTFDGQIVGSGAITQSGPGSHELSGLLSGDIALRAEAGRLILSATNNTFTGGITAVTSGPTFGTIQVAGDEALGNSANIVTLAGGVLDVTSSFATARPVVLGENSNGNGTIDVEAGATLALNGSLSGATSLFKSGAGELLLNTSATFGGFTTITQGTLAIGSAGALPGSSLLIASGGTLDLSAVPAGSAARALAGLRGAGAVQIGNGSLTIGSLGSADVFSGVIGGSGALIKTGPGVATFSGNNSFTGGVQVNGGTLVLSSSNTFSGNAGINGGVLSVSSDANLGTSANNITFNGGTLQCAGNFSSSRSMDVSSSGAINIPAGNLLTENGTIGGSGVFHKSGTGVLRLTNINSFAGTLQIDPAGGTVSLAGSNGAIAASTVNIALGGSLELNNATITGGNQSSGDRISDSAAFNFNGGMLSMIGADNTSSSELVGPLNLLSSATTISLLAGSGGSTSLSFASLQRTIGASMNISGLGIGDTNRLLLRTTPGAIGAWLKVNGLPAKYDAAAGLVATTFPLPGPTPDLLWGDTNTDGLVNKLDYATTLADLGHIHATWAQGDFNGDGIVDQNDLNLLLGNAPEFSPIPSATPEPAIGVGLLLLPILARRTQNRR